MGEGEEPGAERRALRRPALALVHDLEPGVLEHLVVLRRQGGAEEAADEAVQAAWCRA
jgi:hypothetical protein